MSSCEKCWADAYREEVSGNECQPDAYHRLLFERRECHCTPEQQAGPDAGVCTKCGRQTLHQHTGEPMCGC